jgi:hypothetical protein
MSEGTLKQATLWQQASGLVSVGLTVWITASVATLAALSNSGLGSDLRSDGMRTAVLVVGFALGALALLGWGTFGLLSGSRQAAAVLIAAAAFLLPWVLELAWQALAGAHPPTLVPGLLLLLSVHCAALWWSAMRDRHRLRQLWLPEAALLLLGLAVAFGDLVPQAAAGVMP